MKNKEEFFCPRWKKKRPTKQECKECGMCFAIPDKDKKDGEKTNRGLRRALQ